MMKDGVCTVQTFDTISGIRECTAKSKEEGKSISLVPTMGALHEGHRSCIDVARTLADVVIVSVFVNPTQFGPKEDYGKYPRALEEDLRLCGDWGVAAVFAPDIEEMYPGTRDIWVDVERFSEPLCGRTRAGHFRGVATVVLKLFNIVGPDSAVFGQKDAQQAIVIHEMVKQLDVPVEIALAPTHREHDGLARSSRNAYLSADERARAAGIYRSLLRGKETLSRGERDPDRVIAEVRGSLEKRGIEDIEYAELLDARDLSVIESAAGRVIVAVAARVGQTRLIDNLVLEVGDDGAVEEAALF
jgi:pantoate--beta-alanine ligase